MPSIPIVLPEMVRAILHLLLERAEQIERKTVVRVHLSKDRHADYWNEHDHTPRMTTNTVFQDLEAQGLVRLHWQRDEVGNWLKMVDLVNEHTGDLYLLLDRVPLREQEKMFAELLHEQQPVPGWHDAFLEKTGAQLAAHRSIEPLDLAKPQYNRELLVALSAIAHLKEPTFERILSIRIFGNSKHLGGMLNSIVTVLRRYDSEAGLYGDDNKALLQAHYVDTVPEHTLLSGSLVLQQITGQTLDTTLFQPSLGLSALTLYAAKEAATSAHTVITVENETSFTELALIRPASVLLLFSSGFASPTKLRLLQKLRVTNPHLSLAHWGDFDVGGLRILAHLRTHLFPVTSLAMDVSTFMEHQQYGQPLTPKECEALVQLRKQSLLEDCWPVIDAMLVTQRKLEQEAIRPSWFLDRFCG